MKEGKIFLGADHAGFDAKEEIRKYIISKGILYEDLTPEKIDHDDYPDYAFKVAQKVAKTKGSKGILVCGSGTGMVIAANKVKGIRAVAPYDTYSAKMSRSDNDTNVIGLRGRNFPREKAKRLVNVWLNTPFSGKARHERRIRKIANYER